MRVTSNMMMANSLYNIGNNMRRMDKTQQQQATQSKIQLPSDDPEVATQAVKYRDYVSSVAQYHKNVEDATGWMKVSEGALNDLHDVVQKMRELTVKASNTGTMNPANLDAIKQEVSQLKKTAVQILNTSYAGRYIFAGYETDKEPFGMTTVTAGGSTVERITYKGKIMNMNGAVSPDADAVSAGKAYQDTGARQALKYNVGFNNQLTVNVEGQDIVGSDPAHNLFATLDKLMLGLEGKTSYKSIAYAASTGSVALPGVGSTVTAGTNDKLTLAVDGGPLVDITIPAGNYVSPSALVAAINKEISASALNGKVTVSLNNKNQLVFTSASTSATGAVAVSGNAAGSFVGATTPTAGGTVKTTPFTLSSILGDLDADLDRISAVNAGLGARENTAGIADNRLGDDKTVYTKLMATNESVDAGEAEMNAAAAKVVYESSLAATAKAVSKSLLDYLG
ncbi:flagellar hook-associated protein FlgL [Sporomusa aerivorans]|uniref:flagellar hook-associated protein FlgL n=1 Tax=Sporomusa aerivorans TaxID=204936 RepID=UPI00352B5C1B